MKRTYIVKSLLAVAMASGLAACHDDNELTTNIDGVELTYFGEMPAMRGQAIKIHGKNLSRVKSVIFPIFEEVSDLQRVDDRNINVTVPEEALAGKLRLVTMSGDTLTSKSTITFAEEIEVTDIAPLTGVLPGDILTISGDCVYNIAAVTFGNGVEVTSDQFLSATRRQVTLAVPAEAQSGLLTLSDGNSDEPWVYEYPEPLEIMLPTVDALDKTDYDFEQTMTITGTKLQYVKSITFPSDIVLEAGEFTVNEEGTQLQVEIPEDATSGQAVLTLYSGATLTTPAYTLPVIEITGASLDGNNVDIYTGFEDLEPRMYITISGKNLDRLKRLFVPGVEGKFTNFTTSDLGNGIQQIAFTVPNTIADGNISLYQNESVTASIPATLLVELPFIWKGYTDLGEWSGNMMVFDWNPTLWKKFWLRPGAVNKPGVMTFYFNHSDAVAGDHYLKLVNGDWATPWSTVSKDENFNADAQALLIAPDKTNYKVEVTAADIANFQSGFVIFGSGLVLNAIKFEPGKTLGGDTPPSTVKEPKVIWDTPVTLGWGSGQRIYLAAEDFENAKPGDYLRFDFDVPEQTWNQAQLNDGAWANNWTFEVAVPDDLVVDGNPVTKFSFNGYFVPTDLFGWNDAYQYHQLDLILTQEHLDRIKSTATDITDENQYGIGMIIQGGDKLTVNKVSIVPNN